MGFFRKFSQIRLTRTKSVLLLTHENNAGGGGRGCGDEEEPRLPKQTKIIKCAFLKIVFITFEKTKATCAPGSLQPAGPRIPGPPGGGTARACAHAQCGRRRIGGSRRQRRG